MTLHRIPHFSSRMNFQGCSFLIFIHIALSSLVLSPRMFLSGQAHICDTSFNKKMDSCQPEVSSVPLWKNQILSFTAHTGAFSQFMSRGASALQV